jgi:hypothetical protein
MSEEARTLQRFQTSTTRFSGHYPLLNENNRVQAVQRSEVSGGKPRFLRLPSARPQGSAAFGLLCYDVLLLVFPSKRSYSPGSFKKSLMRAPWSRPRLLLPRSFLIARKTLSDLRSISNPWSPDDRMLSHARITSGDAHTTSPLRNVWMSSSSFAGAESPVICPSCPRRDRSIVVSIISMKTL